MIPISNRVKIVRWTRFHSFPVDPSNAKSNINPLRFLNGPYWRAGQREKKKDTQENSKGAQALWGKGIAGARHPWVGGRNGLLKPLCIPPPPSPTCCNAG